MHNADFSLRVGDTSPSVVAMLRDSGDPLNVNTGSVLFRMSHQIKDVTIEGFCSIIDGDRGEVAYSWSDGDTDVAGRYDAAFLIDYENPHTIDDFDVDETIPPSDNIQIEVVEQV